MKKLLFLIFLTGCKVGPPYEVPVVPIPSAFVEEKENVIVTDEELCHWWEDTFKDPLLNQLLEETLESNFDLGIAMHRVYQAKANYWTQFTAILPELDGDFQATRFRTSQSFAERRVETPVPTPTLSPYRNFYQIGLDAIWELDLFGKLRGSAESAFYAFQATCHDMRGVKLSVLSETASTYVRINYYQTKIALSEEIIAFDEELVNLFDVRLNAGLASEEELNLALSTLITDRAAENLYIAGLKANIYALAVLLGRLPESLVELFSTPRKIPESLGKIPTSLTSDLLRRRPDIASAERNLAAQTELIGVALAELFPKISLIGSSSSFAANPLQGANIGFSSDRFRELFKRRSRIWGIGTLITWPVFDFGKRLSVADAEFFLTNQAYLTYRKTVVTAFQEVETALSNYFLEEERLEYYSEQNVIDKRNVDLIFSKYMAGLADYIELFQAKERWLVSSNAVADSQEQLALYLIALYKALGGDW